MNWRVVRLVPWVVVLLGIAVPQPPVLAQERVAYTFEAFPLQGPVQGAEVLFRGETRVAVTGQEQREVTLYRDPAGKDIQRVEAVFRPEELALVSYEKEDLRTGEHESMTVREGSVEIRYRKSKGEREKRETLRWSPAMSFISVIMPRMRRDWERLMRKETIETAFLVPSRLETVGFRLVRGADATIGGRPVVEIVMEPSSWVIRRLVNPLHFLVEAEAPHRLLEYRGRTSVTTPAGDPQDVHLVYAYPPGAEN